MNFLLYSNLFVSFCAVALVYRSLILFNLSITENINLLILTGLTTFVAYNFQRIVRFEQQPIEENMQTQRLKWTYKYKNYLKIISIIVTVISVKLFFSLHLNAKIMLLFVGFISFFYVIKFIPINKKWISLREIPYLKLLLIALVWSVVTVVLPMFNQTNVPALSAQFYLILLQQFLFILAITIPFDNRDVAFDVAQNLKTLPVLMGKTNAVGISVALLIFCILIAFFQWFFVVKTTYLFYESLIFAISATLIIPTKKDQHEFYYALLIEGTMLLLAFSVLFL